MNTLIIENWQTIGTELKNERERQHKTRAELIGESHYLHLNTMHLVETNKVKPTLQTISELTRVLGYDGIIIKFRNEEKTESEVQENEK